MFQVSFTFRPGPVYLSGWICLVSFMLSLGPSYVLLLEGPDFAELAVTLPEAG